MSNSSLDTANIRQQLFELDESKEKYIRLEKMLKNSESRFRSIFENSLDVIIILNCRDNVIIHANPSLYRILHYKEEDIVGKPFSVLFQNQSEIDLNNVQFYDGVLQSQTFLKNDCSVCYMDLYFTSTVWDEKEAILVTLRDVSERKKAEEKIAHIAMHDILTDLPNRNLFIDRMQQAISSAKRQKKQMALLYIDLDKFKPINDRLGHKAGDEALLVTARRLEHSVRANDTVARIGGDEFVIIIQDINTEHDVTIVAQKIINIICQPFSINDKECTLGVSIGIGIYPHDGDNLDQLMKNADSAMYHAKKNGGGNNFVFFKKIYQSQGEKQ
ncbi:MAG: GGDEF domain-containing protein [Desulfobacterales bacterium]|nr:GGDEF domain-containing protein [Desulfobacterales bacterium]